MSRERVLVDLALGGDLEPQPLAVATSSPVVMPAMRSAPARETDSKGWLNLAGLSVLAGGLACAALSVGFHPAAQTLPPVVVATARTELAAPAPVRFAASRQEIDNEAAQSVQSRPVLGDESLVPYQAHQPAQTVAAARHGRLQAFDAPFTAMPAEATEAPVAAPTPLAASPERAPARPWWEAGPHLKLVPHLVEIASETGTTPGGLRLSSFSAPHSATRACARAGMSASFGK
jgi:hypothetical protein